MTEILIVAVIGALLNLDVTAVGRIMVSRPIIVAPVIGYILGDFNSGLWMGLIIELLWIGAIPMGAAIPYDTTILSVIAVYWGIRAMPGYTGTMVLAIAVAIPAMILHKRIELSLRYLNIGISHWVEKGIMDGKEERISYAVFLGVALYYLQSLFFYLAVLYPGRLLVSFVYSQLPFKAVQALDVSLWLLPLAGIGILLVSFHNKFPCRK